MLTMELLKMKYRPADSMRLARKCPHGRDAFVGSISCKECIFHEREDDLYVKCSFTSQKWEYMVVKSTVFLDSKAIDKYGNDGWELVTVLSLHIAWHYHFKRPLTEVK